MTLSRRRFCIAACQKHLWMLNSVPHEDQLLQRVKRQPLGNVNADADQKVDPVAP